QRICDRIFLKKELFLDPERSVPNNFVADYKKWHRNTFSNLQDGSTIQIIEIPQYYTVVLTFSSEQYVDAKVTISDFPAEIKIVGDLSETRTSATSAVRDVIYTDENNDEQIFYAATFWIETELLEVPLSVKQQYSRFDIDLNDIKPDILSVLLNHGIPKKYSLTEQVLHLPIQTAAGRTTLVNGDPISVEEALVNHAPQYFTNILNKTHAQTEKGPDNLLMEKKDKTLFDSTWHNLQTYKGFFDASAGMLEKGISWSVISKTYNAAFGMSSSNSDTPKLVSNILGISGSASGFLDLAKTFESQPPVLKGVEALASVFNIGKYPKVQQMVDNVTDGMSTYLIPDRLRPFVSQHRANANAIGKFAAKLTGTPLSVAGLAYNFHTSLNLSDENVKQNGKLLNITEDYTGCTQSAVEQMSLMSKAEFDEHKSKVSEIRTKLKVKLAAYTKNDKNRVKTEVEKIGDLSVQLINVGFDFNNAKLDINDEGQSVLDAIANSLLQLTDPINIKVIGHTCFIGSDEYNMALSLLRAKAFKEALIDKLKTSENIDIWKSRIEIIGRGEKDPLVDNNIENERYKNRRVEVQFLFSTAFQYPPCRSGISAIESQRRATVASSVKEDAAWLNTASGAFDIALGIGAGFLGPIGVSAYALWWSNNMLHTGMDILNQTVNKNYDHYVNLKKYSEFGVVTQSMLVNNDPDGNNASFIKKAYLKRALALNGLFRLIHRYHYEPKFRASNKYKSHSDSGLVSEYLKEPDCGEQQIFF
ncbi:MAG: OmpA family protein, partial [Flavobacteriaceae bacterium]|nr:OmpA family protein [Flavobacteriaceae bacterium]